MNRPGLNTEKALASAQIIRQATQYDHRRLEQTPLSKHLLSPSINREEYLQILITWYHCWHQLDNWLLKHVPNSDALAILPPPRSQLLLKDIHYLSINKTPPLGLYRDPLFLLDLPNAWFGVAYVVEGSRLGSHYISRHLKTTLNIDKGAGLSFFSEKELSNGYSWQEWLTKFNVLVKKHQAEKQATEGAIKVYQWLTGIFNRGTSTV